MNYTAAFMELHRIVPLGEDHSGAIVGTATEPGVALRRLLQASHARPVRFVRLSEDELTIEIQRLAAGSQPEVSVATGRWSQTRISGTEEGAPGVNIVNSLLNDAVRHRASDIHIEDHGGEVVVRYRIDGALRNASELAIDRLGEFRRSPVVAGRFDAVSARVKVLAGLNAAERRRPQDGRFTVSLRDDTFDVRFSSMPTIGGESLVLRIFPRTRDRLALPELGMPEPVLTRMVEAITRRSGFILLSGPTGSGKTTTLHAALNHINLGDRKIITIEDPVEYRLAGIEQVQTNEAAGLTFESLLRRVLRQDPNVIMIGEIRDSATAALAVRAALTGHLVLATIHSRSAADVRERLVNLGVEPTLIDLLAPLLVAQRLVRTGASGRTGLFAMIADGGEIISLELDGAAKVRAGITTEEEVSWATHQ